MSRPDDADHGDRHQARERALSLLYEAEQKDQSVAEVLAALPVPPDDFAVDLVTGVADHRASLDATIDATATNWRLDRMALLDLLVLRLGTYELVHRPDVPPAVAINEAVELAKSYCGDDSPSFVNGILATIADQTS